MVSLSHPPVNHVLVDRSQDPLADEERLRPHEVQVEGERLQPGALLELLRHAVLRLGLGERSDI